MSSTRRQLPGQPFIALGTAGVAAVALIVTWWITFARAGNKIDESSTLLLLCLFSALILAYHFPIHVDLASKVYMGSIVLYVMATLLPPAVASTGIGVGILAGELSVRHRTGNHRILSVIPTQVARWILIGLLGSLIAHAKFADEAVALVAAAVGMFSADIFTGPLLLSPLLNRRPLQVIRMMVRQGAAFEGAQYVVALMGVFAASTEPWALGLLLPPAGLVYFAFMHTTRTRIETRHMFEDIADTADQRDAFTNGHSRRVADLVHDTLRSLGKRGPQVDLIVFAARVHDIGMIGIPEDIARKLGALSPAERAVVETHAEKGADLLARYADLSTCARIIRHHHEAWDGTGYPHRLKGTEIPFGSRVTAVAESYDAMTSDRPYRRRMTPNHAATILRKGRGIQWDPEIVDALLRSIKEYVDTTVSSNLRLVQDEEGHDETG